MNALRDLVIVTKHKKETVIQPLIENNFNFKCFVTSKIDTDELGTFSGELKRELNPIEAARRKCYLGLRGEKVGAAISSEGSFGPHPAIPFLLTNEEIVLFLDEEEGLEIVSREISLKTNAHSGRIENLVELKEFAKQALFPSHGLILRPSQNKFEGIKKGIVDEDVLMDYANFLINKNGQCYVETDMRALYNPTRMAVIKRASENLIFKMKSRCECCNTPGFDVVSVTRGLPCRQCGFKTNSVAERIYKCSKCSHSEIQRFPNGETEDPLYCDICNP